MNESVSVVIVDDHDLIRYGLAAVIEQHSDIKVVGEAGSVTEAIAAIERARPDVVLLDMMLGDEDGMKVLQHFRHLTGRPRFLVLTAMSRTSDLQRAIAAGADGYLLKTANANALRCGIVDLAAGLTVIDHGFVPALLLEHGPPQQPLPTTRELQVIELVADGMSNNEIGSRLGISGRTAQKHLENLFAKFGVRDRTELVVRALRTGLLAT